MFLRKLMTGNYYTNGQITFKNSLEKPWTQFSHTVLGTRITNSRIWNRINKTIWVKILEIKDHVPESEPAWTESAKPFERKLWKSKITFWIKKSWTWKRKSFAESTEKSKQHKPNQLPWSQVWKVWKRFSPETRAMSCVEVKMWPMPEDWTLGRHVQITD